MPTLRQQLDRLQTAFIGLVIALVGLALMVLARQLTAGQLPSLAWLTFFPLAEIGGLLFSFGLLGIGIDYVRRRHTAQLQSDQLRQVITEEAPALRDAVIRGFAFNADDLARVATPELLDQIIRNSLTLRLGDATFAREIYNDIRDQAIASTERWHDARVEVKLSPLTKPLSMDKGTPGGSSLATTTGIELFVVTVRWEYTTVPANTIRRFVCVSDTREYRELRQEAGTTSAWFFKAVGDLDGGSKDAFELVQFTIDGTERPIRRSARPGSQTYSVAIGKAVVDAARPVTVACTYRTLVRQDGRLIKLDVEQPTRGLTVEMDYGECDITEVRLLDFLGSSGQARISRTPPSVPARVIRAEFDGWVLPRGGVVFAWERAEAGSETKATAGRGAHSAQVR